MYFKLEPVTALAPLGSALVEPHKLDVGVFLVTDASNHSVGVHGLNDVGLVFGSLTPARGLHEEGARLYDRAHGEPGYLQRLHVEGRLDVVDV